MGKSSNSTKNVKQDRQELDELAQAAGYADWLAYETAVKNGDAPILATALWSEDQSIEVEPVEMSDEKLRELLDLALEHGCNHWAMVRRYDKVRGTAKLIDSATMLVYEVSTDTMLKGLGRAEALQPGRFQGVEFTANDADYLMQLAVLGGLKYS